jgi:hypothetical protein
MRTQPTATFQPGMSSRVPLTVVNRCGTQCWASAEQEAWCPCRLHTHPAQELVDGVPGSVTGRLPQHGGHMAAVKPPDDAIFLQGLLSAARASRGNGTVRARCEPSTARPPKSLPAQCSRAGHGRLARFQARIAPLQAPRRHRAYTQCGEAVAGRGGGVMEAAKAPRRKPMRGELPVACT